MGQYVAYIKKADCQTTKGINNTNYCTVTQRKK